MKEYTYAGCELIWSVRKQEWMAYWGNNLFPFARASGIKPMQDKLRAMKIAKEGPWKEK